MVGFTPRASVSANQGDSLHRIIGNRGFGTLARNLLGICPECARNSEFARNCSENGPGASNSCNASKVGFWAPQARWSSEGVKTHIMAWRRLRDLNLLVKFAYVGPFFKPCFLDGSRTLQVRHASQQYLGSGSCSCTGSEFRSRCLCKRRTT